MAALAQSGVLLIIHFGGEGQLLSLHHFVTQTENVLPKAVCPVG